jgi:hypothetical protein
MVEKNLSDPRNFHQILPVLMVGMNSNSYYTKPVRKAPSKTEAE